MKVTKYRMDQLDEARRIQKECLKQHLPCPPVAWWRAEIKDENEKTEEIIESKCNSYTRNGLNIIAANAIYPSSSVKNNSLFGNGIVNIKNSAGAIWVPTNYFGFAPNLSTSAKVVLGVGVQNESLESYIMGSEISTGWSIGNPMTSTIFNSQTNKLISSVQRTFINNTGSTVSLTESGIKISIAETYGTAWVDSILVVRDLFESPIAVQAGKSIIFSYNLELLYPQ